MIYVFLTYLSLTLQNADAFLLLPRLYYIYESK